LVKIETIQSGNTFGACFWTDGKCEAPCLPDLPWLQRHPKSNELFWTDECEKISEEDNPEDDFFEELLSEETAVKQPGEYADTPYAVKPSVDDYNRALATGLASSNEKERHIRMRLWWAANDPIRRGKASTLSDRDNLLQLLELLNDSDPEQRLMAAEARRELGNFDRASMLLQFNFPDRLNHTANFIKKLNEQKDVTVRQVK
jgi:hypothetical protein